MLKISSVVLHVLVLLVAGWLLLAHPATLRDLHYWRAGALSSLHDDLSTVALADRQR